VGSLLFKWGTVISWDLRNSGDETVNLFAQYLEDAPLSLDIDYPSEKRKKLLCQVIDKMNGTIRLDSGDGKPLTKKQAKDYVMNYKVNG